MDILIIITLLSSFNYVYNKAEEWNDLNFIKNLKESKYAIVSFVADWCGHCKRMKPLWDEFAIKATDLGKVVRIYCSNDSSNICNDYDIQGYPTIKFIKFQGTGSHSDNLIVEYKKSRDLNSFIKFFKFHVLPPITIINDEKNLELFINDNNLDSMVLFSNNPNSEITKSFQFFSNEYKSLALFGHVENIKISKKYNLNNNEGVIFFRNKLNQNKKNKDIEIYNSNTLFETFFKKSILGDIPIRTIEYDVLIVKPIVTVFVNKIQNMDPSFFKMLRNRLSDIQLLHNDVTICMASFHDYNMFLKDFEYDKDKNDFYIIYEDLNDKKYVFQDTIKDIEKLKEIIIQFVQNVKENKIKSYLKSEIEPNDKILQEPVYTLVGTTFDKIVNDPTKDVLIEFYAPWCGHCKSLEPIYKELAITLKDEPNLIIAKIDATSNYIPKEYKVTGFPTIYLSKINQKDKPILYNDARTVERFIFWLKENGTNGLEILKDEL